MALVTAGTIAEVPATSRRKDDHSTLNAAFIVG
jgi:hypothetical protein